MTLDVMLVTAGALAVVVAGTLRHLNRYSVSPPMLALVAGVLLGPQVLDVVEIPASQEIAVMRTAARLLLAVALMSIALRFPLAVTRSRLREVVILVLVVLPAMAAVVGLGANVLLGLPLAVALALGAALSPTDPVLASGIASSDVAKRDIPARGREVLSVESGANDGLAMPLVVVATALVLDRSLAGESARAAYEVVGGVLVGVVAGAAVGWAMRTAKDHREIATPVRELYTLLVALFVLGLGSVLHVNGLLGVFVAGLAHNRLVSGDDRRVEAGIEESLNQFLVIPVFMLLGVVLPWSEWAQLGWAGVGFVAVALLLRRLPVVVLLRPVLRAPWHHVLWLGWFGPIGVAAIFYLGHLHEQGVTDPVVWAAGTLVVASSTVVHGLTAGPARLLYQRDGDGDRR